MVDMGLFCMEFWVGVGWDTRLGRAKKSEWICAVGYLFYRIIIFELKKR